MRANALWTVAITLSFIGAPLASIAQEPSDQVLAGAATEIDALLLPQSEAGLVSGVILVARGKQVLFERAFGFANWELEAPNAASTRFGVGSITKSRTEVLVHLLVREGRIDLDEPVESYIRDFPRGPDGGIPTLRHLLTHRSGVPHRVTDPADETQYLTPAAIVERVRDAGLMFEPGTDRLYSSAGFTSLARIIELVEGQGRYLQSHGRKGALPREKSIAREEES